MNYLVIRRTGDNKGAFGCGIRNSYAEARRLARVLVSSNKALKGRVEIHGINNTPEASVSDYSYYCNQLLNELTVKEALTFEASL